MKKLISLFLISSTLLSLFPPDIFALSTAVNSPESYPGKMDVKNVNGLGKNLSTDFFGGAMTFRYPFVFPGGSRGMTPTIELSYSSNNTDAFSPYGYGFSLSLPRIQRSAKKGVSELYLGNEFSAFGNDLIAESGSTSRYWSKDGNDVNIYTKTSSGWLVQMSDGKKLTFGASPTSRIADTQNVEKIYAWMLESEEDLFGHKVQYEYFQNGGQPFVSRILYGFDTAGQNPLYEVRFSYVDKTASLSSYKTQFEIKTTKLLSDVSLFASGNRVRSYVFSYDALDVPVSHLVSIGETSPSLTLPKMEFMYGEGQFRHMITKVNNNRGGIARFEYTPSTGYRTGSGELMNNKLPFMVMTLSRQTLEDSITGIRSTEQYEYSSGAYYYDSADIWGREYVGFGRVTISDEKRKKILSFYQSQTAEKDIFKFEDHIAKKGRVYRTQIFDKNTGKLLQEEIVQYDMRTLFGERRLVFPKQKLQIEYGEDGQKNTKADTYLYDNTGNLLEESHHGFVNPDINDGTWIEIPGDETKIIRTYTENPVLGISKLPVSEKVYGFSGELLSASRIEYDGLSTGATYGLVTAKVLEGNSGILDQKEFFSYSPTGMNIEKKDALGNTTSSLYDAHDIALTSTKNPLGWETRYLYNYTVGKPEQVTNQNTVITRTTYDPWGRELQTFLNFDGVDTLVSEKIYDDTSLPNSITSFSYFDTSRKDKKLQKAWLDGWGRTVSTLSSMKDDGQYTLSHIRYDSDGNPLYASYPYFVASPDWQKDALPYGAESGESYRTKIPGVSYSYDALGRIIREKTSRGITEKTYVLNTETLTNALGYKTMNTYDAYGNLLSVQENDGKQDIITRYIYDALNRPRILRDTLGNIRTWEYDVLGRLTTASDIHAPSDTTYGIRKYSYDALGRLKTYENPNGEKVSYTYDTLSRPLTETIGTLGVRNYTYDTGVRSLGTLSTVTDTGTTVSYTYDPLGRKISENRTLGNTSYLISYTYNLANTLTSLVYPDNGRAEYGYKNGFADTLSYTDAGGQKNTLITGITYSPNSTMNTINYGNGVIKTIDRDADYNYRLTHVRSSLSGSSLLDTSYTYDAVSNITRIVENGIDPLRKTVDYIYDPLGRLLGSNSVYAVSGYGRDTIKNLSYTYDPLGNILSSTSVGNYTYNGEGYANPHAVTTAGNANYTYDVAGNTITRTTAGIALGFSYSPYGEMLSSTKNGETTSYTYDHTRRRVIKSSLGLIEHHVIDGYEVEYESGAVVPMSTIQGTNNNTGITNSGSNYEGQNPIITNSGTTNTGVVNTGATNTGTSYTGTTSTGISLSDSGTISTDSMTSTGETSTGTTSTGTIDTSTGTLDSSLTNTGETSTGTLSGSGLSSTQYMFIAGYESSSLSGSTPATLTTILTHIMLGDERIATFQTQSDDSPKTPDNDTLIYHLSDHLNSSSLDLSSTGIVFQAVDYEPFGKSITYEVTNKRIKGKKGGYTNKYQFANKQLDDETDLQYFEKRYYDNRIGRFTTEDPVFWEVGLTDRVNDYYVDPQQWNSYSYVRNNPLIYIDPLGEKVQLVMRSLAIINKPWNPGAGAVHSYLLITPEGYTLNNPHTGQQYSALTIGGHPVNGFLLGVFNDPSDLFPPPNDIKQVFDIDIPKGMSEQQFVQRLIDNTLNFNSEKVPYNLLDTNCNRFATTILDRSGYNIDKLLPLNPSGINTGLGKPIVPAPGPNSSFPGSLDNKKSKLQNLIGRPGEEQKKETTPGYNQSTKITPI